MSRIVMAEAAVDGELGFAGGAVFGHDTYSVLKMGGGWSAALRAFVRDDYSFGFIVWPHVIIFYDYFGAGSVSNALP